MAQPNRILVADDEPTARLLMSAALKKAGFEVHVAVDGEDALQQFHAHPCDLVMLDVEMPGLNGYQVCAALRQEIGNDLPIVMVTAMDDADSIERAYECGATDFISKPINWSLIGHRVRYLLRAYFAALQLRAANARNAAVLNAIPDLLFEMDIDGRYINFHSPQTELLAAPPEVFIGRTVTEVLPSDAADVCLSALREAHDKGVSSGRQLALQLPHGVSWFELSVSRMAADSGDRPHFVVLSRNITERKNAEAALRYSESRLHQAQAVAHLGSWHLDMGRNVLEWSPETYRIFGLPEGSPMSYETFLECVYPEDRDAVDRAWHAALRGEPYHIEHRIEVGGVMRWIDEQAEIQFDVAGNALGGTGTAQDITERKEAETKLRVTMQLLDSVIENLPNMVFMKRADDLSFVMLNKAGEELLGYSREQLMGKNDYDFFPREQADNFTRRDREVLERGFEEVTEDVINTCHQGQRILNTKKIALRDETGEARYLLGLSVDITERKEAEKRTFRLAYFDSLTGLPNRQSFLERLDREVKGAEIKGNKLAILFMDLDGFKGINDTMGHNSGDLILQWAADRLRKSIRPYDLVSRMEADQVEVELARLGGDEFTALIPNIVHSEDALRVAHRIREQMRRPFVLEGREVVLTTSIGIAVYPDDGMDAASLLKHADTAMYHAKDKGRDNCQFYSASLTQRAQQRLNLESNLRQALERSEFSLLYQPQFDLASGSIHSVEALIRWNHPTEGIISPMDFIPLAEENGLIVPIGEWVLRTACTDAARWKRDGHGLTVAVNLSPMQFRDPDLLKTVLDILAQTGLPPDLLELEVTESAVMEDSGATLATLEAIHASGVQIALDDFGTGYSSMSYLKRMPLNNLKVDQSFVQGLPHDRDNHAIVRAILSLAKNLGFRVTAEGVETLEQVGTLKDMACDTLQGYYFSKPVAAAAIPLLLERRWEMDGPSAHAALPASTVAVG